MRPGENHTHVRFVQPVSLGNKHALKQLTENEEWDISVEGQMVRISQKLPPPAGQEAEVEAVENVTYVPFSNVEFLKCETLTHKRKPAAPGAKK